MDIERAFITKLCQTGDMPSVQKDRFTGEVFIEPVYTEIYGWIDKQYIATGQVPSVELLREEFEEFEPEECDDEIPILVNRLNEKRLYAELALVSKDIRIKSRTDPKDALSYAQSAITKLTVTYDAQGDEIDISKSGSQITERYERNKNSKGLLGYPFPWARFTAMTRGARGGHHLGFYGDSGSMKTWLLIYLAIWFIKQQIPVVLFTKETPVEDIQNRAASILAEVDYERFQDGALNEEEETRFYDAMDSLELDNAPLHIIEVMGMGAHALAEIKSKIFLYGAKIAMIDNLYYYAENLEWQNFGILCNGIRQMARKEKMPIFSTNQTNNDKKAGAGFSDVGYGKVYAQSCTELIRIVREPMQVDREELILWTKKLSEGKPGRIAINAKPGYDFSEKAMIEDGDPAASGIDDADITLGGHHEHSGQDQGVDERRGLQGDSGVQRKLGLHLPLPPGEGRAPVRDDDGYRALRLLLREMRGPGEPADLPDGRRGHGAKAGDGGGVQPRPPGGDVPGRRQRYSAAEIRRPAQERRTRHRPRPRGAEPPVRPPLRAVVP